VLACISVICDVPVFSAFLPLDLGREDCVVWSDGDGELSGSIWTISSHCWTMALIRLVLPIPVED
jgi:hypothetical protein